MKSILFLVDNFKVFFFFERIFPGKETKSRYERRAGGCGGGVRLYLLRTMRLKVCAAC